MKKFKKTKIIMITLILVVISSVLTVMIYKNYFEEKTEVIECVEYCNTEVLSGSVVLGTISEITYLDSDGNELEYVNDTVYFNFETTYANLLNERVSNITNSDFAIVTDEEATSSGGEVTAGMLSFYTSIDITYDEYENIGSVVIDVFRNATYNTGEGGGYVYVENINLETGNSISNLELINMFGVDESDASATIYSYFEDNDLLNSDEVNYSSDIDSYDLYIENSELYVLVNYYFSTDSIKIS